MRHLEVDLPEATWIPLPTLAGDRLDAWATATAAEVCGGEGSHAIALSEELSEFGSRVAGSQALACAVLLGGDVPHVEALLVVDQAVHEGGAAELSAQLAAEKGRGDGDARPDTREVDLPVGRAVRLHEMTAAPDGTLIERVEHIVPLGDDTALRSELSWRSIAAGEQLSALADQVAGGLRLRT